MTSTCRSVNVHCQKSRSHILLYFPCRLELGHYGDCTDGNEQVWTRLGEHLRQRGQLIDGDRLRKAAS